MRIRVSARKNNYKLIRVRQNDLPKIPLDPGPHPVKGGLSFMDFQNRPRAIPLVFD